LQLVAPAALLHEIAGMQSRGERPAVLAHSCARPAEFGGAWIAASADAARYAHDLYANLRALDAPGVACIVVESVPEAPRWLAVRDRLSRAAN
jgi:L-threonylcarbamoyladenylate synthase